MIRRIFKTVERIFHWDEFGTFDPPPAQKTSAHVHGGMPSDLKTSAALMKLIEAAKEKLEAMTPEEQQAMWQAQRESWVRGEMQLDRTNTPSPPAPESEIIREIQTALEDGAEDIYIFWAGKCRLHVTKDM
ncbi:hypothetical protein, partial [Rhizobium sp. Root483D2]|uniref:hypothetical protein n=1 Tax=Rhizobium sp. Root483D2 TaxID=1736545 RepID=UPI000B0799A1